MFKRGILDALRAAIRQQTSLVTRQKGDRLCFGVGFDTKLRVPFTIHHPARLPGKRDVDVLPITPWQAVTWNGDRQRLTLEEGSVR